MNPAEEPGTTVAEGVLSQRRRALRARLLSNGYLTNWEVAALRDTSPSTARSFVARERRRYRLFTVKLAQTVIVPRILLDDRGDLTVVTQAV